MTHADPTPVQRIDLDETTPNPRHIHPNIAFLASLLDDFIPIPGTTFRVGLDGIIGLIPVAGDLIGLFIAGLFMKEAERLGVSRWTKARMYGNYAVDTVVGMIPIFGDAFDFGFKAHRRNLRLLQEHLDRHPEFDGSPKRYVFRWPSALLAAFAASIAITLYMLVIPKWFGMEDMDIGLTVAGLTAPDGGTAAFLVRLAWHMGNGIIYVFLYAAVLRYRQKQSTAATGAAFGVFLWFAGPMLMIPMFLSWWGVPAHLTNPGIFMRDLGSGWTPATIDLGAHLVHGTMAGIIYKHGTAPPPSTGSIRILPLASENRFDAAGS